MTACMFRPGASLGCLLAMVLSLGLWAWLVYVTVRVLRYAWGGF
jgi:hypothetical protein